jgi:hypothetical protein
MMSRAEVVMSLLIIASIGDQNGQCTMNQVRPMMIKGKGDATQQASATLTLSHVALLTL